MTSAPTDTSTSQPTASSQDEDLLVRLGQRNGLKARGEGGDPHAALHGWDRVRTMRRASQSVNGGLDYG